ncbi:hypothetical protein ACWCQN_39735 [Streptomyces sp. NPDC001984]
MLASAARSGTHALLANGRYDDALELGNTAAAWLSSQVTDHNPAALSLMGMIHLRAAVATARHQDRPTATALLNRAEEFADDLGSDENCACDDQRANDKANTGNSPVEPYFM